jgi:hypothetical protein
MGSREVGFSRLNNKNLMKGLLASIIIKLCLVLASLLRSQSAKHTVDSWAILLEIKCEMLKRFSPCLILHITMQTPMMISWLVKSYKAGNCNNQLLRDNFPHSLSILDISISQPEPARNVMWCKER